MQPVSASLTAVLSSVWIVLTIQAALAHLYVPVDVETWVATQISAPTHWYAYACMKCPSVHREPC